jgi:predicted nucleic acid-binding protein
MSNLQAEIPHLYLDTSVIAGVLQKQHTASTLLLDNIVKKEWKCSTSAFASMELFDITQDNAYVLKELQLGVHIKKAYKSLDQKNLSKTDLEKISDSIQDVFPGKYTNIRVFDFEQSTWVKAIKLKATTNISAPDVIHLATAIEAGCDLLVTLDQFFKKEAEPYIKTCLPEKTEKVLKEMGFKI